MFKYTSYFEKDVLAKRPYIKKEWCERVIWVILNQCEQISIS
ncbi:MAG: hypothetical protein ABIK26_04670 [Candidatus Omnitrophota bacterium]